MSQNNDIPQNEQEDFEKLLEDSLSRKDDFTIGDEVQGKIVYVSKEYAFVDITGKSEAIIDIKEFTDDEGTVNIQVGDSVKAYIVKRQSGEILLTTTIGIGHASPELLEKAYRYTIPVQGTVIGTVKGGYQVSVSGIHCFCPISQIDLRGAGKTEDYLQKSFTFKITQFTEKGKNIILSRRALLEEKKEMREKAIFSSVKEGDVISGQIASLQNFGILVDLDGMEALIPRSEISWSRNADMEEFKPGDAITAKVLSMEEKENKRIILSLKQMQPEPWTHIGSYKSGLELDGRVTNIIKSGAFVEMEPGIEGFIPVSRMSLVKRVNRPEDVVSKGDIVSVRILEIRKEERRISLELITDEPDPWKLSQADLKGKILGATVESSRFPGLTVRLENGMQGFIPKDELISAKGDIQNLYPTGAELRVVIKSLNQSEKKLIASERDALKEKERKEYEQFVTGNAPSESVATLGNIFKTKFDEIQKKINKP